MTDGNADVIMANRNGRAIRFHESKVREMGRTATGVRGMELDEDGQDEVVGMICVSKDTNETVMVVSQQGYGKRTLLSHVRIGRNISRLNGRCTCLVGICSRSGRRRRLRRRFRIYYLRPI